MHDCRYRIFSCLIVLMLAAGGRAQTPDPSTVSPPNHPQDTRTQGAPPAHPDRDPDNPYPASVVPSRLLTNLAIDQKDIWTSPFRARIEDLNWLLPVTGLTAGLINADSEISSRISVTGTAYKHSGTISNGGLGALVAGAGGIYVLGKMQGDDHKQETGILSGEAALNSYVVAEVLKVATRRERPNEGTGLGRFGQGTIANSGFVSAHSILAWSIASVISREYPGPLTKLLTYGIATGVSVTRITSKNHFPSDVLVGSTMGYLIGRQVYARHHDAEVSGPDYGVFHRDKEPRGEPYGESISSPYVPMDSWVYPAFERLSALGVIPSGMLGMRPWTRRECARLLEESPDYIDDSPNDDSSNEEAARLRVALAREFAVEMSGAEGPYAEIDSVYARATGISGKPLTDGYHFGKTIVNDYGRPYQEGGNFLAGFSGSGSAGPFGYVIRGEFDHAPSAPALPQSAVNGIQLTDDKPPIPSTPFAAVNQFRLLDSYFMLNLKGWQTSFGKQTLWLGPTQDPFLASDNAEPMYMFRVDQTTPHKLPSVLGFLGPYRVEFWVGKLAGHHFINTQDTPGIVFSLGRTLERQPLVNGTKVNFRPSPNFEFGVGRTGLWGGPDFPITLGSTRHSFFSAGNTVGRGLDPGDRRSTFDFSYRIPGFRKWLTLYDDSFVEDEISPIGYPRRAAHNPGIYMPQLPKLPHVDFRVEAAYTNLPNLIEVPGGGFFYFNDRYLDGYTIKGNIIGNGTVGRQGISFRGSSTYWFASDKNVQLGYRTSVQDPEFAKGGAFKDFYARSEWAFNPGLSVSSLVQYEWWNFPLLTAGKAQNDFTASVQITYHPHWKIGGGR